MNEKHEIKYDLFCSKCGQKNKEENPFCSSCGQAHSPQELQQKDSNGIEIERQDAKQNEQISDGIEKSNRDRMSDSAILDAYEKQKRKQKTDR